MTLDLVTIACFTAFTAAIPLLACTLTLRELRTQAGRLVCEDVGNWVQMAEVIWRTDLTCYLLGGTLPGTPGALRVVSGICFLSFLPYAAVVVR